ncbi:triose-phosphate isomerase [Desulfocurvus vexinensis]|uniref:triose-phosphate isomerase n=1 Tax=Desulfocurvus vexinensis TaxID=399548 RepID=UPI00048EEA66|nr:triose-phosphate isomerase [Desulfocurvus vexinensis]
MKKLMAANWKMHKTTEEAFDTAEELVALCGAALPEDREVLVIPPFTALRRTGQALAGNPRFLLGGQNFYPEEQGAFTGEISPAMLLDVGCAFVLAGHSERRHVLGETDEMVGRKVAFGLERGLSVILCVGERIDERRAGQVEQVLRTQLDKGLAGVDRGVDPERLVVAYEPVWAIGTGEVAGPQEIVQAHAFVRQELVRAFGEAGREMRIQYGGSVKPDNAAEIIHLDNVDGVLVGGASLRADSFSRIVLAD